MVPNLKGGSSPSPSPCSARPQRSLSICARASAKLGSTHNCSNFAGVSLSSPSPQPAPGTKAGASALKLDFGGGVARARETGVPSARRPGVVPPGDGALVRSARCSSMGGCALSCAPPGVVGAGGSFRGGVSCSPTSGGSCDAAATAATAAACCAASHPQIAAEGCAAGQGGNGKGGGAAKPQVGEVRPLGLAPASAAPPAGASDGSAGPPPSWSLCSAWALSAAAVPGAAAPPGDAAPSAAAAAAAAAAVEAWAYMLHQSGGGHTE
mmetsp:Transcript_79950/g.226187  ORF Transcript_79950/g.226187 Transcript_79950/m.226187 type:complete len:267 (-) Transcript_79950:197-997(-)